MAVYDAIADWYEHDFLGRWTGRDPLRINAILRDLLGTGSGVCLDVGCGTGIRAEQLRVLGWTPLGVDLSTGMLRHARDRLPVARADAEHLPLADASVPAAVAAMVHTDLPGYPAVLREVARVLRPGGVFVHVGVHPCFCGDFVAHADDGALLIRPGYLDGDRTATARTGAGNRHEIGVTHRPLPGFLHAFLDAGLVLDRFAEGGAPVPTILGVRAVTAGTGPGSVPRSA
jgi:SAM-dependent methyltransferase